MDKEYYILWYRLNGKDQYIIWFSNETDGVVTDPSGNVISFDSKDQLVEYASKNNLTIIEDEPELHNLDLVSEWISENTPELINFSQFNNIWNLWTDISSSTGRSFDNKDRNAADMIYDKLFWSCTLPTGKSKEQECIPEWTENELNTMKELFQEGIAMFKDAVVPHVQDN
ncbi:MAG: hypothetical protein HF314_05135 [Ignavibacteria bacterium]|jgi:hypothetical protein|nr:hypothetical protein [Ignavibacteria bacterium]MCU7502434.1 hypothetical protein [Ignavibacteria bacterium]MCU7515001.1 hypothetical protein [Ignavibacteria bacterium]